MSSSVKWRFLFAGVLLSFSVMGCDGSSAQQASDPDAEVTDEQIAEGERLYREGRELYKSKLENDQKRAFNMIAMARKLGHVDAYAWHGQFLYYAGRDLNNSEMLEDGLSDLEQSVAMGSALGKQHLGEIYTRYEDRVKEGERLMIAAAESGLEEAQLRLSGAYKFGAFGPNRDADYVKWTRVLAENGNPRGQYELAQAYYKGRGVEQIVGESERWIMAAIENSHQFAMSFAGRLYAVGHFFPKNIEKSLDILEAGIDQGLPEAVQAYGIVLFHEDVADPPLDYVLGLAWLEKSLGFENLSQKTRVNTDGLLIFKRSKLTPKQKSRFDALLALDELPLFDRSRLVTPEDK